VRRCVHDFLDLGYAPPSNAYRSEDDRSRPGVRFIRCVFKVCRSLLAGADRGLRAGGRTVQRRLRFLFQHLAQLAGAAQPVTPK
jgi:hypothetical protein